MHHSCTKETAAVQDALKEGLESEEHPTYWRPQEESIPFPDLPIPPDITGMRDNTEVIEYILRSPYLVFLYTRHIIRLKRHHAEIDPFIYHVLKREAATVFLLAEATAGLGWLGYEIYKKFFN